MVARYSDGAKYDAELMNHIITETDGLRSDALTQAEADADAFALVAEAYRLPRETSEEKEARSDAIAAASAEASRPQADVIRLALLLVSFAEELLRAGNRNMITDVAAAAEAARAAAVTALLFIEINLRSNSAPGVQDEIAGMAAVTEEVTVRADVLVEAVREEISR